MPLHCHNITLTLTYACAKHPKVKRCKERTYELGVFGKHVVNVNVKLLDQLLHVVSY